MPKEIVSRRNKVFSEQDGRCYYCKFPMWIKDQEGFAIQHRISVAAAKKFKCTAEHLKARCDGGGDEKENIVAACHYCNQLRHKRKKPPEPNRYKEMIQKRLKKKKWHPISLHGISVVIATSKSTL